MSTDKQRREAHEEIGLPPRAGGIYNVAVLEPIVTVMPVGAMWKHHIIVTRESSRSSRHILLGLCTPISWVHGG